MMDKQKIVSLEDRIPKLKQQRKQRANRRLIIYLSTFFFAIVNRHLFSVSVK
ncbi:MAG: hypothetical protein LRY71_01750 [Bacillaceae bacterium]|nr:hypothetical protein [Bacillaceae bacterium]